MATWKQFEAAAPDLAAFGARRLARRVSYLATIRNNGGPRVHPVTVHVGNGRLFVYMEPTSPKAGDLCRDNRYALHCQVADTNGDLGEFSISGRATVVEDSTSRTMLFEVARTEGFAPQDRYIVFELGVEKVLSTIYDGEQPKRERWNES